MQRQMCYIEPSNGCYYRRWLDVQTATFFSLAMDDGAIKVRVSLYLVMVQGVSAVLGEQADQADKETR